MLIVNTFTKLPFEGLSFSSSCLRSNPASFSVFREFGEDIGTQHEDDIFYVDQFGQEREPSLYDN